MKSRMQSGECHDASRAFEVERDLRSGERARFLQEAEDSWRAFQKTGRHLSGDKVQAWLGTWGTDKERVVPECHN